jgi:hypothetical protein
MTVNSDFVKPIAQLLDLALRIPTKETVEEAGIEPGTAALQSGSPSRAFAN